MIDMSLLQFSTTSISDRQACYCWTLTQTSSSVTHFQHSLIPGLGRGSVLPTCSTEFPSYLHTDTMLKQTASSWAFPLLDVSCERMLEQLDPPKNTSVLSLQSLLLEEQPGTHGLFPSSCPAQPLSAHIAAIRSPQDMLKGCPSPFQKKEQRKEGF